MTERCFSHSKIKTYIECPMLYYWQYVKQIVPKVKPKPLAVGSTVAETLETYRITGSPEEALDTIKIIGTSEENSLELSIKDDPLRSVGNLTLIMLDYFDTYPDEWDKIIRHEYIDEETQKTKKRVEIEFKVPLTSNGLFFEGRIDGLYRVRPEEIAIIEDKTTTRLGDKYFDQYQANLQIMWYLWATNELGAFKASVPRCIINAIYIHKAERRLRRSIILKSKQQLKRARLDLMLWIETIEAATHLNRFPRNLSHCEMWGGCPYKVLRDVEKDSLRERIIDANFKPKEKK
jgi:hypothetical protein